MKKAVFSSSLSTKVSVSKTIPSLLELGPLGGDVIDPERQMTDPALIDAGLARRPAQDLDRHSVVVGEKERGRIATTLEDHVEPQGRHVEILECGRVVGVDREMLDSGHRWDSSFADSRFQIPEEDHRLDFDRASERIVFHCRSVTG